ncbi:MAG: FHA domain-containing serine/threonine-protein kinase [Planctomycetota bacterium]|jgi:tRNA A-37 threonylcarbamoyl transferase component Bud32|nr:FHA domain-containing serine/threonine-protein kinase [Planctomycetota bacterium]
MKRGKLEAIEGKIAGQVFVILQEGELSLGRVPENEIVVIDPRVSRKHCIFYQSESGTMVKDLGSSNGTRLNGERQKSAVLLKNGDQVRTGSVTFRFDEEELEHQSEETREFEELSLSTKPDEQPPSGAAAAPAPRPAPSPPVNRDPAEGSESGSGAYPQERPARPAAPEPQARPAPQPAQPTPPAQAQPAQPTPQAQARSAPQPAQPTPQAQAPPAQPAQPTPPAQPRPTPKPKKTDPMVGTVEGDYDIQDLLGKGAVGAVYKARQISTGRTVAYKILHSAVEENNTAVQRFIREAKTGAQLRHPTITTVYDRGKAEKHLYLAMEYVDGSNLHDIVVKNGVLEQAAAAVMFYSLADGLYHAHQANIVHRDLKPANIMVTKDNKPKLTDLGLAKSLDSSEVQVTAMGTLLGTPGYMAPEQAQGSPDIDSRVDIYSLGATLYYAVTRHHPFSGKNMLDIIKRSITEDPVNPIVHNSNLSLDFVRVIQKAMKRDLAGRYQTCQELADDMAKFL